MTMRYASARTEAVLLKLRAAIESALPLLEDGNPLHESEWRDLRAATRAADAEITRLLDSPPEATQEPQP